MNKLILLLLLLCSSVYAYESHEPILIENVHATKENPYIIEGFEITSNTENCIEVRNSEHVIIRNNYLHDCLWSKDPNEPYSWDSGYAILVKNSEDINIEDNKVQDNKIGIVALKIQRAKILNNDIRETKVLSSLRCERCTDTEIANNYLLDNGKPEWFWVPGHRIIGLHVVRSDDIDVHNNTIIRSSSDGIGISGQIDSSVEDPGLKDWTGTANNIRIYNNVILDNLELGIWLARIRNLEVFNNTIRDHYGGIVLDFDVGDSEFYDNKIITWIGAPITLGVSHNNYVHDNIAYVIGSDKFHVPIGDSPEADSIKSGWAGIPYSPSSGNVVENNEAYRIGGSLKDAIEAKRKRVEDEKIFEEKGWFACEIEEGLVDEECRKREEAKGNQGMPREVFVFEPLMENFDDFVKVGWFDKEEPDQQACETCNYLPEKVYATFFFLALIALIIMTVLYVRLNRK